MKTFYRFNIRNAAAFLMLFFAFVTRSLAQQPQYYNYENVGIIINIFPFGVAAGKEVQWLCLPGEFTQPSPCPTGNINKLYFYMMSTSSVTFTNLTIKLGQTTITSLPPRFVVYRAAGYVLF